jgi:hypothetical protein
MECAVRKVQEYPERLELNGGHFYVNSLIQIVNTAKKHINSVSLLRRLVCR